MVTQPLFPGVDRIPPTGRLTGTDRIFEASRENWGGDIKFVQGVASVGKMSEITNVHSRDAKRPTQVRNEQRIMAAVTERLRTSTVDEVTSRVIAESSGTNVSYIIRYWGGRDALLAAIADQLSESVVELIDALPTSIDERDAVSALASISMSETTRLWIRLTRYLSARDLSDTPHGTGATLVVAAMERFFASVLDIEIDDARPLAVLTSTLLIGDLALGAMLGTTREQFVDALGLATSAITERAEAVRDDEQRQEAS